MRFGISSRGSTWVSFGPIVAVVYGLLWLLAAVLIGAVVLLWVLLQAVVAGVAWLIGHRPGRRQLVPRSRFLT